MKHIKIISASAGSGKTHQLAEELYDRIGEGHVRPEGVLATTFTNRAADELRSRIRSRLLEKGAGDAARRVGGARIGTVNAVCGQLVSEFAFELGLSPDLAVVDEEAAKVALQEALDTAVTAEDSTRLAGLSERLCIENWHESVAAIVDRARANGIEGADLGDHAGRSKAGIAGLLGPATEDGEALDGEFADALRRFLGEVTADGRKNTENALAAARQLLARLESGRPLTWQNWYHGTSRISPARTWAEEAERVHAVALRHFGHPRLREDVDAWISLIFEAAAQALESYRQHKARWGVIDFIDQEVLALQLLGLPRVREILGSQLDLLVIDEFQDTSPIQLAVFLALAQLADRCILVGDQKQSIFGFRGTDPELMGAAMDGIEAAGGELDNLLHSWRSRPALVALTSDLFAPLFNRVGIPEARVRLKAAPPRAVEPSGLGPVAERWVLDSKKKPDDILALAALVRDFLSDPDVRVRDKVTHESRELRHTDIGILCRTNRTCEALADALADQGVPARLPRSGLMSTPEAALAAAGLRYWVDHHDALAAGEIARALYYPADGDGWLQRILETPGRAAFEDLEPLLLLRTARAAAPAAGPLQALDSVIEVLDLRERCLQWGRAQTGPANLDALRGHAGAYVALSANGPESCTVAGLTGWLDTLADDELDTQSLRAGSNAVTLSTWHRAKGLEWPVVILFEYDKSFQRSALEVHVEPAPEGFDLANPLANRALRYWPDPYYEGTSRTEFHQRLAEHALTAQVAGIQTREELRLLYVAWTRARDRVVLAGREGTLGKGLMEVLNLDEPDAGKAAWVGHDLEVPVRRSGPVEPDPGETIPGSWFPPPDVPPPHPPAFVQPSVIEETGMVIAVETIGERIPLHGRPEMDRVGNAVHAFLAADRADLSNARREEVAARLLDAWDLCSVLSSTDVVKASGALRAWIEERWPGAKWHREWPVARRLENGSMLRGQVDLVLELEGGIVVIDHKTYPGDRDAAKIQAAGYAGQLAAYADAVALATTKPAVARYIHLPVLGQVLELE